MRILHVITRLILGGAQQNTVMSCVAQAAAGHEVHLAYGPIYGPEGSLLEEARASGATLHEVASMVREVRPWRDVRCHWALRGLVKRLRPDVVHTHSSKAGILGRAAASAGRRGGRPVVIHTVHGLPFHDRQRRVLHDLFVASETYAASQCDHLVAITDAMVDTFVEKKIAPREKFTVIPSGVDLARFAEASLPSREDAKAALGLKRDAKVVGLVARLDPLKGHADLIAALPAIVEQHADAALLLVGDGFDRANVERLVAESPQRGRITMLDLVALGRMPSVYRAVDVCVLPSYQEGQSRVLVEALAVGCGIVGYDVGGIPEVCVDGDTGLLVPVGDVEALAAATGRLLGDDALRARLVARGRAHVADRFSAERMNRDLLALYARLLG